MKCVFCWVAAIGISVLLAVASVSSTEQFNYLYRLVMELLSLSNTDFSVALLQRPGLGHFILYASLTIALLCVGTAFAASRFKWLVAPLLAGFFGLSMELAQVFIPSRGASLMDVGVNALGVLVGLGLYYLFGVLLRRIPVAAMSTY